MFDLKSFRVANNLYQKDLADYLHVSIGFISSVERGASKLPGDKLAMLIDNDKGWDPTSLIKVNRLNSPNFEIKNMSGGQNFGGNHIEEIHYGKSDEEIENLIKLNVAEYEAQNRVLREKVSSLTHELAFFKSFLKQIAPHLSLQMPGMETIFVDGREKSAQIILEQNSQEDNTH